MNKKQRNRIGQVMTGIISIAMIGGLFSGISKSKVPVKKLSEERVVYEDGYQEYRYGDVVELKDFVVAAHTRAGFSPEIKTGEESRKKAKEGNEFFVIEGALQKQYPGILNLYKQVLQAEVVIGEETYPLKVNIGEMEETLTAHTFSSSDEVLWNLYVELPVEYKEKIQDGYTLNLVYGNEELAKESGLKKYRLKIEPIAQK